MGGRAIIYHLPDSDEHQVDLSDFRDYLIFHNMADSTIHVYLYAI